MQLIATEITIEITTEIMQKSCSFQGFFIGNRVENTDFQQFFADIWENFQ